jgi:hypothetical protein
MKPTRLRGGAAMTTFSPVPNTRQGKVQCDVCGRKGFPTNGWGWQATCLRGHLPCKRGCGKMLAVYANGNARAHTAGCPA